MRKKKKNQWKSREALKQVESREDTHTKTKNKNDPVWSHHIAARNSHETEFQARR